MTCQRCSAEIATGDAFCTACGARVQSPSPPSGPVAAPGPQPADRQSAAVVPELAPCPGCGAANATSRQRCARCGAGMDGTLPPWSHTATETDEEAPAPSGGRPALLVITVLLVTLVVAGVVATVLSARGAGPFAGADDDLVVTDDVDALAVTSVRASSSTDVPASAVLADDLSVVWSVPGDGAEEWIELGLSEPDVVARVVIWNGRQGADFADSGRIDRVRIAIGDERFTARLRDDDGPQAIDLPQPIVTDRVRLTIDSSRAGLRIDEVAVARVELRSR